MPRQRKPNPHRGTICQNYAHDRGVFAARGGQPFQPPDDISIDPIAAAAWRTGYKLELEGRRGHDPGSDQPPPCWPTMYLPPLSAIK